MTKIKTTLLDWTYTPKNYLEKPISISFDGGLLQIEHGKASATVDLRIYQTNISLRDELTGIIESRLLAAQIMTHKVFELSKATRTDVEDDGKLHHYLEIDSCYQRVTVSSIDLVVKDRNGVVVADSKRERLNKQEWYAVQIEKFRPSDATLDQILKSYQASVLDPDNELIRLYEVRESLATKFGSRVAATGHLGLTNHQWAEIGELANHHPFNQGRHRGKSVGFLRDAKAPELELARKSVVLLIEKYLEFLSNKDQAGV